MLSYHINPPTPSRVPNREDAGYKASLADADVEIRHTQLLTDDRLLLCTNGLTDVVSDAEIANGLTLRRRPAEDSQQLVNLAVLRGSHDDITAMVADFRLPY